jgi:phospholipase C
MFSRFGDWSIYGCVVLLLALTGCAGVDSVSPSSQTSFPLTVAAPQAGAGTVASNPAGISCPGACAASFAMGTDVTLTATPATNYSFAGWSGGCSGTSACSVDMTAAETVTATFTSSGSTGSSYQLTITAPAAGTGIVTSSPAGISCPTACLATFTAGTEVTLTATPAANYTFAGWSGACSGTSACIVDMNAAETVSATFTLLSYQLTVASPAAGTGTVTSSPAGINCPGTCAAGFSAGTQVALTATPGTNYVFAGWSGACSGTASCTVDMTGAETVTASFTQAGSLQNLNHIIIFAQENRSFDHYFGYMRAYWAANGIADQSFDGLPQFNPASGIAPLQGPAPTNPGCDPSNPNGPEVCTPDANNPVTSFHLQSICTEEMSPFWDEAHVDWNDNFAYPSSINELLNGFVEAAGNDARQYTVAPVNDIDGYRGMGYFEDTDLNYYYFMASNFATSDRWFSPVMSRTQPNRMYLLAATSQGYAYPIGSDSADQTQLSATTIFEELQDAGITWKIYVNADDTNCATMTGDQQSECLLEGYSYLNQFTYEETVLDSAGQSPDLLQNIVPITQFTTDAQNGTLPQVALIEPASTQGLDEHPSDNDSYPENIQQGAAYAAGLVNTLMTSASWKDSAMIFTFDEFGGFYDHVPPQTAAVPDQYAYPIDLQPTDACDGANQSSGICSFGMTGYRVPLIVISPFAKKNYVSHTVYDTTAVLTLIEKRFGVPALTNRDKAQADMSADFFDFATAPWANPPTPPTQNTNGTCSTAAPTPSLALPVLR